MHIANRHMLYTGGAGLIPIPLFDIAAITALQVKMLSDIAKIYHIPLAPDRGKAVVTALIGGVLPTGLGFGAVGSFMKRIPIVGPIIGVFTVYVWADRRYRNPATGLRRRVKWRRARGPLRSRGP